MINIRKLESELWESADLLRQGSKLTSNQYCMPVLALLFLRYAYSRYKMVEAEILQNRPKEALEAIRNSGDTSFKAIKSEEEFYKNLEDNCIPSNVLEMDHTCYQNFLEARRAKMTELIRKYYYSL